eukprot:g381.t1
MLLLAAMTAAQVTGRWQTLNDTDFAGQMSPKSPIVKADSLEECASFCADLLPGCVAAVWSGTSCSFKCNTETKRSSPGNQAAVLSWNNNTCGEPGPPPPPHLYPRVHFAPDCVYNGGGWHDIAGALTNNGVHHVFQGVGWNHATSTDLVHWAVAAHGPESVHETYRGMDSHDSPCSGYLTKDPEDSNRVCAGLRQCSSDKGVDGMPHAWDVPLELRCALDDNMTAWANTTDDIDYLFNVSFWRPVPYDPARPWREADGNFYQLVSLDACNASGLPQGAGCPAGGQLGMWRSPALRGPKAHWRMVGPAFTSNTTVLPGAHLVREFVTIDFIGTLAGDPAPAKGGASGTRVFLNNVGGNGGGVGCCQGTTSYFPVMQRAPGAPFEQVGPQGMVDWGSFTLKAGAENLNLTGVNLLDGTASRAFSMARTLGSEEADQVTKPGRRVLIGWIGPADELVAVRGRAPGSAQSLPRELSLAGDRSLRQRFVPELQALRQQHRARNAASVDVGLQGEVYAAFPCPGSGETCGLRLGRYGELLVDPPRGLVTLDLTAANNSAVRAGPIPPVGADPASEHAYSVHLYIDRTIIEVIVNNATALVAYWAPPASAVASLAVELAGGAAGKGTIEGWTLAAANNVSAAKCR